VAASSVDTDRRARRITEILASHGADPQPADATWRYLRHPAMPAIAHGWKLHVSTRPDDLAETVEIVLPILSRHVCHAKVARSPQVLRELNGGLTGPGTIGKAITVYPRPEDLAALAHELVAALTGRAGPRVLSDRRLHPDAPVYYRYGPFHPTYRGNARGDSELVMIGPDGAIAPGSADATYRCPAWATDPFESVRPDPAGPPASAKPAVLGAGRYRIERGITRSPCGNVYRATDLATGRAVVVKQARPWTGEDVDGVDASGRLCHERRVLEALSGIDGVPEAVDHFRHRGDDYLVTGDCGAANLYAAVRRDGPYSAARRAGPHNWYQLATRLLCILDDVHARGVVVRDLKPRNVVLDRCGRAHVVDFGTARYDGWQPRGATPGYSLTGQWHNEPAGPADDYHGLGGVLYYAATGLEPVLLADDDRTNLDRSLQCLAAALPTAPEAGQLIAGLLSLDPDERTAAARRLRIGTRPRPARPLPRPPSPPIDAIVANAVTDCVHNVGKLLSTDGAARGARPQTGLYHGSAGIGLELSHHLDHPGAAQFLDPLVDWTVTGVPLDDVPAGLYHGRTGIALFLAAAAAASERAAELTERLSSRPVDWWLAGSPPAGQLYGLAGIGLGHLVLARRAGSDDAAARHLAVAAECRRRLLAAEYSDLPGRLDGSALGSDADFAHGRAGILSFLLSYGLAGAETPEEKVAEECAGLAGSAASAASSGKPALASWCGGLAGAGTTFLLAASVYPDGPFLAAAQGAARACRRLAPRLARVSQCCGLAGTGEFLIDLAMATGAEEDWTAAHDVAALVLARSGGSPEHPVFPDNSLAGPGAGWGTGTAGVLSFFRRLRDRGGDRPCPVW
jgi:hypothetical protein